jgi:NTP pyrophosphatase (non-canonical NTP hydrolase)
MDFLALLQRAKQIREKYSQLEKTAYGQEWSNLNIMEGFVGDVGELMKLVMAKEGLRTADNVDQKLAHELADCLWSVLILSDKYGIDLEQSFMKNMDELEAKIQAS